MTDSVDSSGYFDTKRHDTVKFKADYRRIRKYYKSPERWRKERERRKKAWQLFEEGLSYADIAGLVGVSERTVKRDMAKIKPYYERKVRNYKRRLEEARDAEFAAAIEGKSLSEQAKILERRWEVISNMLKLRKYLRHKIEVMIDLDADGGPALSFKPPMPFTVNYPFHIIIELVQKEKKTIIGSLKIS